MKRNDSLSADFFPSSQFGLVIMTVYRHALPKAIYRVWYAYSKDVIPYGSAALGNNYSNTDSLALL
jgi:hypothetical protein